MENIYYYYIFAFAVTGIDYAATRFFRRGSYNWRETVSSLLAIILLYRSNLLTTAWVQKAWVFGYQNRLITWSIENRWLTWLWCIFVADFCYYWIHRYGHRVRLGWTTHMVHHTPVHLNTSSFFRVGPFEFFSMFWVLNTSMAFLGVPPGRLYLSMLVVQVYQFWIHTEFMKNLGPLEWILNTPCHHRVHHSSLREFHDCNYGGILIIFDRIFGTYKADTSDKPGSYGVTGEHSQNVIGVLFAGWIQLAEDLCRYRGLRNWTMLILGPPEWRPWHTRRK